METRANLRRGRGRLPDAHLILVFNPAQVTGELTLRHESLFMRKKKKVMLKQIQ